MANFVGGRHSVTAPEGAVGQQIQINVNAFPLEAMDQIIQSIQTDRVQALRVGQPPALGKLENIRSGIVRVHLVEPDEVDAELGQAARHFLAVRRCRETGRVVEVGAPKARDSAILKDQSGGLRPQKSVPARRFLPVKDEREIQLFALHGLTRLPLPRR